MCEHPSQCPEVSGQVCVGSGCVGRTQQGDPGAALILLVPHGSRARAEREAAELPKGRSGGLHPWSPHRQHPMSWVNGLWVHALREGEQRTGASHMSCPCTWPASHSFGTSQCPPPPSPPSLRTPHRCQPPTVLKPFLVSLLLPLSHWNLDLKASCKKFSDFPGSLTSRFCLKSLSASCEYRGQVILPFSVHASRFQDGGQDQGVFPEESVL